MWRTMFATLICIVAGCTQLNKVPTGMVPPTARKYVIPYVITCTNNNFGLAQETVWQMKNAQTFFLPLQIEFQFAGIVNLSETSYNPCSSVLSIHLVNRNIYNWEWDGLGLLPPELPRFWIVNWQDPQTYGHEIGHTLFGLRHAWDEDFVDDTPSIPTLTIVVPFEPVFTGYGCLTNNLMNYSGEAWWQQRLTAGQIERTEQQMLLWRKDLIR